MLPTPQGYFQAFMQGAVPPRIAVPHPPPPPGPPPPLALSLGSLPLVPPPGPQPGPQGYDQGPQDEDGFTIVRY